MDRQSYSQGNITSPVFPKHGRVYNPGRPNRGLNVFPIDAQEQNRLDILHKFFLEVYNGHITTRESNLERPLKVLELGSGTGIWAIAASETFVEGSTIAAVDLNPMHPQHMPSCITTIKFDLEEDNWSSLPGDCDLVHIRLLFGGLKHNLWPGTYRKIYEKLAPGRGMLEQVEIDWSPRWDDDDKPPGSALQEWSEIFLEGMDRLGRSARAWSETTQMMDGAHLKVEFRSVKCYLNPWSTDHNERQIAKWFNLGFCSGIEGMSLVPMVETMGMTVDQVRDLCSRVERELRNLRYHPYFPLYIWKARREPAAYVESR